MKKAAQNPKVVAAIRHLMVTLAKERAAGNIRLKMWSLFIYDGERVVQYGARFCAAMPPSPWPRRSARWMQMMPVAPAGTGRIDDAAR